MSKYTNHKHGMTIGYDNEFYVIDSNRPVFLARMRDNYKAVVSFNRYTFDQVNSVNVLLETPANQLVWEFSRKPDKTFKSKYEITKNVHNPSSLALRILSDFGERGKDYDFYTDGDSSSGRTLFFRRRKDALSFIRRIDNILRGIKISD